MEPLLSRKEICARYRIDRSTLFRWEQGGLKFVGGRIAETAVVWWLERRDASRVLGMDLATFMAKPRPVQQKLMEAAHAARCAAVGADPA